MTTYIDFNTKLAYYIDGGKATITGLGNHSASGVLAIPSKVKETESGTEYAVVAIGASAFTNCTGLTSVSIPSSVTSIGETAFYGCSGLTAFIVDSNNITYISVDGVLFNKSKTILIQFPAKKTVVSYTIPESVTSIGNGAFAYCTGLTSLTIGSSVTIIGNAAFLACSKLTSLTIGSGVTSIGNAAFAYCTGLTSVSIPASVTTIGNGAFQGCSGLTSVSIPASVTSIGFAAFQGCTGVFSAYFFGDYFTESGPAFKGNLDTTIYVRSDAAGWGTTWGGCNVIKSIVKHNYSIYFRKN